MRALQALVDKAEFEIRQGTPPDIASRGLFEACAEVLEEKVELEQERDELAKENAEYAEAITKLRVYVKELLDEDIGYGDPEPGDILDAYKTLAQEVDELEDKLEKADDMRTALQARADAAEGHVTALTARLRELEPAGEGRAALIERVRYLEAGLGRITVEAYKLRKGAL